MRDRVLFLISVVSLVGCLIFAVVSFAAPLLFTFSRDELALAPRRAALYVRNADRALDEHDIERAAYYLHFLTEYEGELRYTPQDREHLERVEQKLAEQRAQYAELVRERDYWSRVNEQYADYRDAKYALARAWYGLGETERARVLLEEAVELDPQCEECKDALSEVLSSKF